MEVDIDDAKDYIKVLEKQEYKIDYSYLYHTEYTNQKEYLSDLLDD